MKKYYKWITAFLLVVSVFFGMTSCQPETEIKYVEVEKQPDGVAPADVTNLVVTNKDASVLLTWTDATDEDIYGYEVSWKTSTENRAAAAMESNSLIVAPGAKGCYISNLTNGTEYTFTVKSVDTSGNKSTGVTKTITPSIIEKSALQIALEPNTTERTNQDVVITVNATTDSASKLKKITYIEGTESKIDTVLAGKNITETKQITATVNTTFTVAVTDTAGRRELAFVTVKNIDKTAPTQVANVIPIYSRNDNAIKLSWTNPADEDFAGTEIVYGKTDSEETTTLTFDKNTTSATIKNIADDDSEYTIAIKTKDDVGNLSEAKTVTVVAATGAKITSVILDRTHLDSIIINRNISVTITGSNFDLLSSLLVQVTDGSKAETPVTATINKETNTATATVIAPVPASPTNNGTTYTVKVIVDSTTPAETTAEFVVSLPADVRNITLAQTQIPVGTEDNVTATIKGYNFDIRGVTKVKLLDSNGDEVIESTVEVPLETKTSETEFTVDIRLPTTEGVYTVAVFFDDVKDTNTTTLQVYGTPVISEVKIPVAGSSYGGNVLPVTINGKNFTAPGTTESGFTSTGAALNNVKIVSDTKVTAEVACPYAAGTTNVTVSYGDSSATTTLKVIALETSYKVGDIILTDGTKVSVADVSTYTIDETNKPVGVVAMISDVYGVPTPKVIGLQKSASSLMWAPSGTIGYNTKFTDIICTPSETGSGAASTATFTGDTEGSDNWDYICSRDPEGTLNAATNYPIFDFANTYGTTAGLTGTDYETGWYVPSIAELCEVYKNKEVIQTSLDAASGFTLGTSYYWSSSQYASICNIAYQVHFYNGGVHYYYFKYDKYDVLVLQALTAK
nr:fibronectin type III domain-containing protein [Treponema sp.]